MRREESLPNFLTRDLLIRFGIFIPIGKGIYSWWSYRFSARAKKCRMADRLFLCSGKFERASEDAKILTNVMGSDHCPVEAGYGLNIIWELFEMTKIDIISGFLGAGKTTLIKNCFQAFAGEQVVLINEFGEIGIDGGFLKESGIEIREMNSGCICCSLVGDFGKSLREVVDTYHPDRILIEPSGVGKLSDVIKAVQDVQSEIDAKLNSFTTVVDVTKCRIYRKNFGEFFSNQIEYAGAVILSRTDKAKPEKIEESIAIFKRSESERRRLLLLWNNLREVKFWKRWNPSDQWRRNSLRRLSARSAVITTERIIMTMERMSIITNITIMTTESASIITNITIMITESASIITSITIMTTESASITTTTIIMTMERTGLTTTTIIMTVDVVMIMPVTTMQTKCLRAGGVRRSMCIRKNRSGRF